MEIKYAEMKDRAEDLKATYANRDALFDEMEQMYFIKDNMNAPQSVMDRVKVTLSPDPRNKIIGAVRLLVATDPVFSVPEDEDQEVSSILEKFMQSMWMAAGKLNKSPIHYDLVLSAMLYGEAHLSLISTSDLLGLYKSTNSRVQERRAQKALSRTPYLFEVLNPKQCYPAFDRLGLTEHYREIETTVGTVINDWGDKAASLLKDKSIKDKITLAEYWDLSKHGVWVKEASDVPIMDVSHGMSFIPIEAGVTDGSIRLFSDPEQQRQPFLYALAKSGLWNRQNLALTVMYTLTFAMGANPQYLFKTDNLDNEPEIDESVIGGMIKILNGEEYAPMKRDILDPSIIRALEIAERKITESTIFDQALGAPLGGSSPYSLVALLHQAGRLPLVSPQRRLEWLIGSAMEKALEWIVEDKDKKEVTAKYNTEAVLLADQIPDNVEIMTKLDIDMPQDMLQAASVVANLKAHGVVSDEWILENILREGQPEVMRQQIWSEKFANNLVQAMGQSEVQKLMARLQQAQQPQQPGLPGMGGGQLPMPAQGPPGGPAVPGTEPMEPIPGPMTPPQNGGAA